MASLFSDLHKSHAAVGLTFGDTGKFDLRGTYAATASNADVARDIVDKLAAEFAEQLATIGRQGVVDPERIGREHVDALASDIVAAFEATFGKHYDDADDLAEEDRRNGGRDPDARRQEAMEAAE